MRTAIEFSIFIYRISLRISRTVERARLSVLVRNNIIIVTVGGYTVVPAHRSAASRRYMVPCYRGIKLNPRRLVLIRI